MSELTFSHLSSDNFELESQRKAGRKRPRIREAVSCRQCRTRKVRCDREKPCYQCVERGVPTRCVYTQPRSVAPPNSEQPPPAASRVFSLDTTATEPSSQGPAADTVQAGRLDGQQKPKQKQKQKQKQTDMQTLMEKATAKMELALGNPGPYATRGAEKRSFVVGMSHWLILCRELPVACAMVNKTGPFESSLTAFQVLKERLRQENVLPPSMSQLLNKNYTDVLSMLSSLLPDRAACEKWIGSYFHGYDRLCPLTNVLLLVYDIEQVFSPAAVPPQTGPGGSAATKTLSLLRTATTVALGMQTSVAYRLHGRRLGRLVEYILLCIAKTQKPCFDSTQILVMILLLRTITASDTDGEHDIASLIALGTHMTYAIGLHRDPDLLPLNIHPCYAELRRRVWGIFLQLDLSYASRCGTKTVLHLDDMTSPAPFAEVVPLPPTPAGLDTRLVAAWTLTDEQKHMDATFVHGTVSIALLFAPAYQKLVSSRPRMTADEQDALCKSISEILNRLPPRLPLEKASSNPMRMLQQTLMSICTHSFLLVIAIISLIGSDTSPVASLDGAGGAPPMYQCPVQESRQPQLIKIWDHAMSIIGELQALFPEYSQERPETSSTGGAGATATASASPTSTEAPPAGPLFHSETQIMALQLLWAHAGRATLAATHVRSELRRLEVARSMPFSTDPESYERQNYTARVFHKIYLRSITHLSRIFRSQYHLGPVTARMSLLMSLSAAIYEDHHASDEEDIVPFAGAASSEVVREMTADLNRRRKQRELFGMPSPTIPTAMPDTGHVNTSANAHANAHAHAHANTTIHGGVGDGGCEDAGSLLSPLDSAPMMPTGTAVSTGLSNAAPVTGAVGPAAELNAAMLGVPNAYTWAPGLHSNYQQPCMTSTSSSASYSTTPDFMGPSGIEGDDNNMVNLGLDVHYPNMGYAYSYPMPQDCPAVARYDPDADIFPGSVIDQIL